MNELVRCRVATAGRYVVASMKETIKRAVLYDGVRADLIKKDHRAWHRGKQACRGGRSAAARW